MSDPYPVIITFIRACVYVLCKSMEKRSGENRGFQEPRNFGVRNVFLLITRGARREGSRLKDFLGRTSRRRVTTALLFSSFFFLPFFFSSFFDCGSRACPSSKSVSRCEIISQCVPHGEDESIIFTSTKIIRRNAGYLNVLKYEATVEEKSECSHRVKFRTFKSGQFTSKCQIVNFAIF